MSVVGCTCTSLAGPAQCARRPRGTRPVTPGPPACTARRCAKQRGMKSSTREMMRSRNGADAGRVGPLFHRTLKKKKKLSRKSTRYKNDEEYGEQISRYRGHLLSSILAPRGSVCRASVRRARRLVGTSIASRPRDVLHRHARAAVTSPGGRDLPVPLRS